MRHERTNSRFTRSVPAQRFYHNGASKNAPSSVRSANYAAGTTLVAAKTPPAAPPGLGFIARRKEDAGLGGWRRGGSACSAIQQRVLNDLTRATLASGVEWLPGLVGGCGPGPFQRTVRELLGRGCLLGLSEAPSLVPRVTKILTERGT